MPKTINDIIPPSRRKVMEAEMDQMARHRRPDTEELEGAEIENEPPRQFPRPIRGARRKFPYGYILAGLALVVVAVVILYAFSGAKVTVTPRMDQTAVTGEFSATRSTGDLPYELISVSAVSEASVPAEGTEQADDAAQGTLTVYNAQTKPQQLIKNTRFESPTGLIYRIHESITVPGGSASVPGSVNVTAYADASGEKYNIPSSAFTVPGLKGSATYDLVYARSTEAMAGGFSGMRPSVAKATKDAKLESMKAELNAQLATDASAKVQEGYILIPGASWTTYEPQPDGSASAGTVVLKQKGTMTSVIFPSTALAEAISFRTIGSYNGQEVVLSDYSELTLGSPAGAPPSGSDQTFAFTLSGKATVLWQVDMAKVAGAVAGKSKDSARTILIGFPEIDRFVLMLKPFWKSTFPADPADITVKLANSAK